MEQPGCTDAEKATFYMFREEGVEPCRLLDELS